MATRKWYDLAESGFHVGAEKLADGKMRILLLDVENKANVEKLSRIGFARLSGSPAYMAGMYYLATEDQRVKGALLADALGIERCPLVEQDTAEISRNFRAAFKDKTKKNLWTALNQSRPIGLNFNGSTVMESPNGRLIQRTGAEGIEVIAANSKEGRELGDGAFLYANDPKSLAQCADGFFNEIVIGKRMDWRDLEKSAKVAFANHLDEDGSVSDWQLRTFQEAVEAASFRSFDKSGTLKIDRMALARAENYYGGLPVAKMRTAESIALQQYSTPLPMGVVAQRLLVGDDAYAGRSIMEPTVGHGGLLTLVRKHASIFALELDKKRAEEIREGHGQVLIGDALELNYRKAFNKPDGFDYTITNPPFGAMERDRSFDKIARVKRADHFIALKALEARKSDGRSVLIIGADQMHSQGEVNGGSRSFMEYVYDHYEVHGAVELDGRMYSRQGAGANVRMFVVGQRRDNPITAEIPQKLPILASYDATWTWADDLVRSYSKEPVELKRQAVLEGKTAVFSDMETSDWIDDGMPSGVVSMPNPGSVGTLDTLKLGLVSNPEIHAARVAAGLEGPTPDESHEAVVDAPEKPASAVKPVPAAAPASEAKVEVVRSVNEYQTPYQSASKVGPSTGMVPINLAGAAYAALNDLENEVGSIDDYVAGKLQYPREELGKYFSPEQVDALGLSIAKMDDGRGFTNSDFTGFGKGRFCAAMLRYSKLQGKTPVFLTLKPELFTDIFRDLKDIDSDHLFKSPFIFNENVSIMKFGSANDVLHKATSASARKEALEKGALPEGTDLVLATYSQFQRRPEINKKSGFLAEIAKQGTTFVVDEAHVAAGESNISVAIGNALSECDGVVFASATPFKGVANFHIYGRMFPASIDLEGLPDTLKAGGEALMEAISSNMARDGVFIRRELDLSKLEFSAREPSDERRLFNRQVSDQVAEIVSRMSFLSGDVSKIVSEKNKEFRKQFESMPEAERSGNRLQASSMNFGSRLYNINRQFLLSLVVEDAAQTAIEALQQGRKPVIAVENTGESLLREVLARRANVSELIDEMEELKANPGQDKEAAKERISIIKEQVDAKMASVQLDEPPQFRDLMEVMLERIGNIKVMKRYGVYETEKPSSEEYLNEEAALLKLIRDLPPMPLSALDVINQKLRDHGYEPTEVSGRTVSLHKELEKGRWVPEEHKKANAVAAVAGYQNGSYDCITITRAGSTGISLHATGRFEDSDVRQREFIVAQKAANIAEFLQWMGRVNRRDQVCEPVMRTLETGLPAEARLTMMHNAKLRRLSANTTSNRDNSNIEGESLDLLNELGDSVALGWLTENPRIASDLDIDLPTDEDSLDRRTQDCPYINKLMGRLVMVPVAKQEEILATLGQRFAEKLEELEQQGINPFKVDVYEWGARVDAVEELVSPTLKLTSSTFDEPVKITTLKFEEEVQPIRKDQLLAMIKKGVANESFDWGSGADGVSNKKQFKAELRERAEHFVIKQLPADKRSAVNAKELHLDEALKDEKAVSSKRAKSRMDFLQNELEFFKPGILLDYEDQIKGHIKGYVTDVSYPSSKEGMTSLGEYRMKVVFPGESQSKTISLASVFSQNGSLSNNDNFYIQPNEEDEGISRWIKGRYDKLMAEFNDSPSGVVTRTATVLGGNIFRSVELAANNKLGRPILYTDEEGNRQRAVLVKSNISVEKIKSMPMGMDASDVIQYVKAINQKHQAIQQPLAVFNNAALYGADSGGIEIERRPNGSFYLSMPGTKSASGKLIADGNIFDLGDKTPFGSLKLKLSGSRKIMKAQFPAEMLPDVLQRLSSGRHVNRFYIANLDMEVVKGLQQLNRAHASASQEPSSGPSMY